MIRNFVILQKNNTKKMIGQFKGKGFKQKINLINFYIMTKLY